MEVPSPMPALRALEYLETHEEWGGYRSLCRLLHREEPVVYILRVLLWVSTVRAVRQLIEVGKARLNS